VVTTSPKYIERLFSMEVHPTVGRLDGKKKSFKKKINK
jgi:hypothetical protein